jgi:hypothetical protein
LAIPARRINLQLVDKTKKAPPRFFETQYRWSVDSMVMRLGQNEATAIKGVADLSRPELVVVASATATVK